MNTYIKKPIVNFKFARHMTISLQYKITPAHFKMRFGSLEGRVHFKLYGPGSLELAQGGGGGGGGVT